MRGTIRRTPNGTAWRLQVKYRDPTGTRRYLTATVTGERADAERELRRLVDKAEHRARRPVDKLTVAQLLDRWLATHEHDWSPGTVLEHRRIARDIITPTLGPRLVEDLDVPDVDAFYGDLATAGHSPAYRRRIHSVLRAAIEQWCTWQVRPGQPAPVNVAKYARKPHVPKPRKRATTPAEMRAILAAATERPELLAALHLDVVTGARRGQLCALRWTDFDLDRGRVTFSRAIAIGPDGPVEKGLKEDNVYTVGLDPITIDLLRVVRKRQEERSANRAGARAFVFSAAIDGSRPWWPTSLSREFRKLRDAAGISERGLGLHSFRHMLATQAYAAGFSDAAVAAHGGWRDATTPANIYAEALPEQTRAITALMAGLVGDE